MFTVLCLVLLIEAVTKVKLATLSPAALLSYGFL